MIWRMKSMEFETMRGTSLSPEFGEFRSHDEVEEPTVVSMTTESRRNR